MALKVAVCFSLSISLRIFLHPKSTPDSLALSDTHTHTHFETLLVRKQNQNDMVRWSVAVAWCTTVLALPLFAETTALSSWNGQSEASESIPMYNPAPSNQSSSALADIDPNDFQPDAPKTPNASPESAFSNDSPTPAPAEMTNTPSPVMTPTPTVSVHCADSQVEMSIEDVPGIFCVKGPKICSGSIGDGNCPGAQKGLGAGSHCAIVRSGVYGCRKGSANQA